MFSGAIHRLGAYSIIRNDFHPAGRDGPRGAPDPAARRCRASAASASVPRCGGEDDAAALGGVHAAWMGGEVRDKTTEQQL